MNLSTKQKQHLKGLAHPLKPVVLLGSNGLTEGVLALSLIHISPKLAAKAASSLAIFYLWILSLVWTFFRAIFVMNW